MGAMGRLLAWSLVVPLAGVGLVLGHEAAYRIVFGDDARRARALVASGHSYSEHVTTLLGLCAGLLLVAFALRAAAAFRSRPVDRRLPAALALLPPVAFLAREYLERAISQGDVLPALALDPTFVVGLAIQIPFGVLAFLLGRWLGDLATIVGRRLASAPRPIVRQPLATRPLPLRFDAPLVPALARGYGDRGPPRPR
jgi:hypothetical protein